jgi:hypothetical protein
MEANGQFRAMDTFTPRKAPPVLIVWDGEIHSRSGRRSADKIFFPRTSQLYIYTDWASMASGYKLPFIILKQKYSYHCEFQDLGQWIA